MLLNDGQPLHIQAVPPGDPSAPGGTIVRVRMRGIHPGDRVRVNKRGRVYDARVLGAGPTGGLIVEPLDRRISWRQATAREVIAHWPHGAGGDGDRPADGQLSLDGVGEG
jgi:hypothetical protein